MSDSEKDSGYLQILVRPIRVCLDYKPKLGGGKKGKSLEDFQGIYSADPFYSWMGLDHPLMYAAHKAAGGMTSVYRQIGIGVEALFRQIVRDALDLDEEESTWSYTVPTAGGKEKRLTLDARIPLEAVRDDSAKERISTWIKTEADSLGVDADIRDSLKGIVFEIRQGYKSKDSKRQNADMDNAAVAYTKGYLPCLGVMSQQIDGDIGLRYRAGRWVLLTGILQAANPRNSIYSFTRDIVGYDLAEFFERNKEVLRAEIHAVLSHLLSTDD